MWKGTACELALEQLCLPVATLQSVQYYLTIEAHIFGLDGQFIEDALFCARKCECDGLRLPVALLTTRAQHEIDMHCDHLITTMIPSKT